MVCRDIKLSFQCGKAYFAETRFFLGCLRLSEDMKLGFKSLNRILVHDTK